MVTPTRSLTNGRSHASPHPWPVAVFAIRLGFQLSNPGETLARAPRSIAAGIVVAFVVVVLVEMIGLQIFHQPEGMDPLLEGERRRVAPTLGLSGCHERC